MSDKTLVERLRELQNRDCACITQCDFVNAVGAKCCREMQGYGCNLCFNVTVKAIIDAIEREYLPRPRFDDGEPVREGETICIDGELPLKVYWYSVRSDGLTVFSCPTSSRQIKTGELVKRPEPDALDADGVPIRVGDTVWNVNTGERCTVKEIATRTKNAFKGSKVITHTITVEMEGAFYKDGALMSLDRCNITHKQPDSLERIEADAKKNACIYFEKQGSPKCDDCDKSLSPYLECHREMMLDLLNRQREVLERNHER